MAGFAPVGSAKLTLNNLRTSFLRKQVLKYSWVSTLMKSHLQEHDFPVCSLSISGIGEGIKDLLQSDNFTRSPVDTLPYYTICLEVEY